MKSDNTKRIELFGLRQFKLVAVSFFLLLSVQIFAGDGTVDLTAFPGVTVSDGRSTITVSAQIRESNGQLVPDGTQVLFETNLGRFRESIVSTQNGFARAVLVSSSTPGNALVRATALKFQATTALSVQFVADRESLANHKDYIEVVAPQFMAYSVEDKILEANGENRGVQIRYRDIKIEAEEVQIRVTNYEVRAKNAVLTIGEETWVLDELYMRLNQRMGVATTLKEVTKYRYDRSWFLAVPVAETVERLVPLQITNGVVMESDLDLRTVQTEFVDISYALTIIKAKKAIAYPSREVDFYDTQVFIGGQKIMSVPLFRASTHPQSPIISQDWVHVYNNDVTLDYPYYLDMKPGQTSLLRFVHNKRYGAGAGAAGGTLLNYEFNWNKGYEMDGGLTVTGLARDDWGFRIRQFWKPSRSTTMSGQIDFPAHKSMFINLNVAQDFNGFFGNLNMSDGQSLGSRSNEAHHFNNSQYSLTFEKDPIKLTNNTDLRIGMTASKTTFTSPTNEITQNRAGFRARLNTKPIHLAKGQYVNFSYTLNRYLGSGLSSNISQHATMSLASSFTNGIYLQTGYDYIADGITDTALGKHRISANAYYSRGRYSIRGYASKSLDVSRLNANVNFNYRASQLWRFNYGMYTDQYLGDAYFDQTFVIAYRLGFREIGISYSHRRKRLGLEILGTTFN